MTPSLPSPPSALLVFFRLLTGLLLLTVGVGHAADRMACEVARFDAYADAQVRWQRDLTRLIISRYPDLASVATLYRDDQLVRTALRRRVVMLLGDGGPQSLDTKLPLRRWGLLDAASEQRLAERDPEIARLLDQRRVARERPPHPDGDALRRVMRETLMHESAYAELLDRLTAALAEAEAVSCD